MSGTRIRSVVGRRVWDSRGHPTVEAEVHLVDGAVGRAIAPAGASTGSGEAVDRRDGGAAFGGLGVDGAVASVSGSIRESLCDLDAADQVGVDNALIVLDGTSNKGRLGGNATTAVSMAVAQAAAASRGVPLWRYLLGGREPLIPMPQIQIFGGGAHAARRVDVQDFMVICTGAHSFSQAIEWTSEIYRAAGLLMQETGRLVGVADEGGYWPQFDSNESALDTLVQAIERAGLKPGEQVGIALDVAASEFGSNGRYSLALDGREIDRTEMIELLAAWMQRYPIISIEDPLGEDDEAGLVEFTRRSGGQIQIVGDDYLVTNAERVRRGADVGACNALLVKPNQAGTLTETHAALDAARQAGWAAIVSARSGETEDVTIAHLAVGWAAGQLKVGSFARSERMAKWNEVLRIEEQLGDVAVFGRIPGTPVAPKLVGASLLAK